MPRTHCRHEKVSRTGPDGHHHPDAKQNCGGLQGASWVAGESFIASVDAAAPMWLWRTIGGFMMVASHIVFFVNLWSMRPLKTATETQASMEVGTT